MQEPTQKKPDHQCKKYQQRARHRGSPVKKADLDHIGILRDKQHRHASENKYQRQSQIHLSVPVMWTVKGLRIGR